MVGGWWSLYRVGWLACLRKYPRYLSRVTGDRVRDRRSCIRTPIPMKLRPTRSARRARRSYLTAVTFRQHFSVPHKIIRLLNKRGFSFRWRWLVLCRLRRCSGEIPVSQSRVPLGKRSVTHSIREYEGEIFTDYYFGEANTANKSDNHHNNAINENFNWGGISGLLQFYRSRALNLGKSLSPVSRKDRQPRSPLSKI